MFTTNRCVACAVLLALSVRLLAAAAGPDDRGGRHDARTAREAKSREADPVARPGREPAKLPPPRVIKGHTNRVNAVAFSSDSRLLATGSDDKTIRIWEMATGRRKDRLPHNTEVLCLAFSPDGKTLASGDKEGGLTLWDVATGEKKRAIAEAWTAPIVRIRFAPDGQTLGVIGRETQAPALYSLTRQKWVATLKGHTDKVKALEFSPDGKTVATASDDSSIRLWDASDGTEKDSLKAHDGPVASLAFASDGKRLASGGRDGTAIVWDVKTGNVIKPVLEGNGWSVVYLAYLPEGRIFTRTIGGGERIWDPSDNSSIVVTKDFEGQILSLGAFYWSGLALSPDGRAFAVGGSDAEPGDKLDRTDVQLQDLSRFLRSSE